MFAEIVIDEKFRRAQVIKEQTYKRVTLPKDAYISAEIKMFLIG